MSAFLSHASRVCIVLLLLGGVVVSFGQVVGIALADAELVTVLGTTGVSAVSVIAGLAAILAYIRSYSRQGRADQAELGDDD